MGNPNKLNGWIHSLWHFATFTFFFFQLFTFSMSITSKTEKYLESLKTSVSLGCLKEDPFLHLSERTELLRGHPSNLHPLLITDLYLAKIFRPYNRWNFSALFASAVDSERRKNLSLWMNNDNKTRKRHFHLWSHYILLWDLVQKGVISSKLWLLNKLHIACRPRGVVQMDDEQS